MPTSSGSRLKMGLIAPCGMYCGACFHYLVDKSCRGCRFETERKLVLSCSLRKCCLDERELTFCNECLDFPCAKLLRFSKRRERSEAWHHGHTMVENLREMKKVGIDAWLAEIERRTHAGEYHVDPRRRFERLRYAKFRIGRRRRK